MTEDCNLGTRTDSAGERDYALPPLRRRFIARALFPNSNKWIERCEESILERPMGGSGDSCVVSRLKVFCKSNTDKNKQTEEYRFIVKQVIGPSERHHGRDSLKSEIKRLSYKIEGEFLTACEHAVDSARLDRCRFARMRYWSDDSRYKSLLIEEDLLDLGYIFHAGELDAIRALQAIEWLAEFHSVQLNWQGRERVWVRGGYWSIDKRSEELRKVARRWELCVDDKETERQIRRLPWTFGVRLEYSAECLDELLYPGARPIPFTREEEEDAYSSDDNSGDDEHDHGRERKRRRLADRVADAMLCTLASGARARSSAKSRSIFLQPTIIHGDFKAENIFFSNSGCAVCDFQWTGFGIGVLDIVSFVFSSLQREAASWHVIEQLLNRYCYKMRSLIGSSQSFRADRQFLQVLFDWALVDYSRYVVGSGLVFPEDAMFLKAAETILARIDGGKLVARHEYRIHVLELLKGCSTG